MKIDLSGLPDKNPTPNEAGAKAFADASGISTQGIDLSGLPDKLGIEQPKAVPEQPVQPATPGPVNNAEPPNYEGGPSRPTAPTGAEKAQAYYDYLKKGIDLANRPGPAQKMAEDEREIRGATRSMQGTVVEQFNKYDINTDHLKGATGDYFYDRSADITPVAVKGAIGLVEAGVGLADLVSGGYAGKGLEAIGIRFKDARQDLNYFLSPQQQYINSEIAKVQDFGERLKYGIRNPSYILHAVAESIPTMLAGGGLGRLVMKAVPALAPYVIVGKETARAISAGIGEGAVTAGQQAEQVRQNSATGTLSASQVAYSSLAGLITGLIGAVGGKVSQRLGIDDLDILLVGGAVTAPVTEAQRQAKKSVLTRVFSSMIEEGVIEEMPQSAQEQIWQNLAEGRPAFEGVAAAAADGLLSGFVMAPMAVGYSRSLETPTQRAAKRLLRTVGDQTATGEVKVAPPGTGFNAEAQAIETPRAPITIEEAPDGRMVAMQNGAEVGSHTVGGVPVLSDDIQGQERTDILRQLMKNEPQDVETGTPDASQTATPTVIPQAQENVTTGQAGVTLQDVQGMYPGQNVTEKEGRFTVTTPDGKPITHIDTVQGIVIDIEKANADGYQLSVVDGQVVNQDGSPVQALGRSYVIDGQGFIELTERGKTELAHETFHIAKKTALTEQEKAVVDREIPGEEGQAIAFQEFKNADDARRAELATTPLGRIWQKILDWANSMRHKIAPTAYTTFNEVKQGRVWENVPAGGKDAAYLSAVESGDMETAQRMVDEAAQATGYTARVFHGTNEQFTTFSHEKLGSKNIFATSASEGFFFGGSRKTAEAYTGMTTLDYAGLSLTDDPILKQAYDKYADESEAILKEEKVIEEQILDETRNSEKGREIREAVGEAVFEKLLRSIVVPMVFDGKDFGNVFDARAKELNIPERRGTIADAIAKEIETAYFSREGKTPHVKELYLKIDNPYVYDYKNAGDDTDGLTTHIKRAKKQGHDGVIFENLADGGDVDTIYVAFSPSQIKSADPVTYDEQGNVIPLSKRFDPNDPRISYSIRGEDGDILKNAQSTTGETGMEMAAATHQAETQAATELKQSATYEEFERTVLGNVNFGDTSMEDPLTRGMSLDELKAYHKSLQGDPQINKLEAAVAALRQAKQDLTQKIRAANKEEVAGLKAQMRELRAIGNDLFKTGQRFAKADAKVTEDRLREEIDTLKQMISQARTLASDYFRAGRKMGAFETLERVRQQQELLKQRQLQAKEYRKLRDFLVTTAKTIDKKKGIEADHRKVIKSVLAYNADALETFIMDGLQKGDVFQIPQEQIDLLREGGESDAYERKPTLEDFQNMVSIIKQLMYQGRMAKLIQTATDRVEFKAAIQDMVDAIRRVWNVPELTKKELLRKESYTTPEGQKKNVLKRLLDVTNSMLSVLRKGEYIIKNLVAYDTDSLFYQATFGRMVEAERTRIWLDRQVEPLVKKAIDIIRDEHRSGLWDSNVEVTDSNGETETFTRARMVAIALNSGCVDNIRAMMHGNELSEEMIQAVNDALNPQEKEFVRAIWDIFKFQLPYLQKAYRSMTGEDMVLVEGKYYPMFFQRDLSGRLADAMANQDLMQIFGTAISVNRGRTMTRKGGVEALDFNPLLFIKAIDQTNNFIAYGEAIRDVNRILSNQQVKNAVKDSIGDQYNRRLKDWLRHIANPAYAYQGKLEGVDEFMGVLRDRAQVAILGWALSTAVMQPMAITQTVNRLGLANTLKGFIDFYSDWGAVKEFCLANSGWLQQRVDETGDITLAEMMRNDHDKIWAKAGSAKELVKASFFSFIRMMDTLITIPTWYSAYQVEIEKSGDHQRAVNYADEVTRNSQGSAAAKDVSEIQQGSNTRKMFVMFYGFFSTMYNELARSVDEVKHGKIGMLDLMRSYLWLIAVPAILQALVKGRGWEEEKDPKKKGKRAGIDIAKEMVGYAASSIPVVGSVINSLVEGYDFRPTPVSGGLDAFMRATKSLKSGKGFYGKKNGEMPGWMRDAGMTLGYLARLPSRQMMRLAEEIWKVASKKQVSWKNFYNLVYKEKDKKHK